MNDSGNFFYRLDAGRFLAAAIRVPEDQRGEWVVQLALDLVASNADAARTDYAKGLIAEANIYREKKARAGQQGGLARVRNQVQLMRNQAPLNDTQASSITKQTTDINPLSGSPVANADDDPPAPFEKIPYQRICNATNAILKSNFRVTANFRKLVKARYQDGFSEEDFSTVCRKQLALWKDDEKMRVFLRPETLFSNKMDGYLGRAVSAAPEEEDRAEYMRRRAATIAALGEVRL